MKLVTKAFVVACGIVQATFSFGEEGENAKRTVVNVNEGVMKPINIALNILDNDMISGQVLAVIKSDLQSTGLFRSIPSDAFLQKLTDLNQAPSFQSWKTINAQYLVNVQARNEGGKWGVSLVIYDVLAAAKIKEFAISGNSEEWRKAAHMAANAIYERIIGEQGYFDTKILYVSVNKSKRGRKIYRLAMMDQDGYNHQYLTSGNTTVLTPRFSRNGNEFSYFGYEEKIVNGRLVPISAKIYRYNINGRDKLWTPQFKGMTYAPRYSYDGGQLIFSLSEKTKSRRNASSIFKFDLTTRQLTRITDARAYCCIDTSPCFSPDGKYIVFNSDRGGSQQLYIMNSDGSNIRRLSFGRGRYATPVWSPRGDWIAFTKFGKDGFYIGIIRPDDVDGSTERMLASGYLVEGPTWSPNGRVVMYTEQDRARNDRICSVDITGYNKHVIKTPGGAIDPEWSGKIGLK